jgi:hypothetical protein
MALDDGTGKAAVPIAHRGTAQMIRAHAEWRRVRGTG